MNLPECERGPRDADPVPRRGVSRCDGVVRTRPLLPPLAAPAVARAMTWDRLLEPMLSAAQRANVAVTRRLYRRAGHAAPVDMRLYRLPADWNWGRVLRHYLGSGPSSWRPLAEKNSRATAGNPALHLTFVSAACADQPFAVVWLPAGAQADGSLLMVLHLAPRAE